MATATGTPTTNGAGRDYKLLLASAVAVGAVAVWANVKGREFAKTGELPPMINWGRARSLALSLNREDDVAIFPERVLTQYREMVAQCVPLIADYMGATLPNAMEQIFVFSRADWVEANIRAFQDLFTPLESLNTARNLHSPATAALVSGMNQTVLSAEVGLLLGYLAKRVLGQYDLALLGKEPVDGGGKLYFVEPNIRWATETMAVDAHDFRLWLALHETTHAFEFEAFPWVRPYFNSLLERYISLVTNDLKALQGGVRVLIERIQAGRDGKKSLMEMVMTPEQQSLFDEMQALMSVVEGYSNHVMNAVGKQVLPNIATMQKAFEARSKQRTQSETLFIRLTGLEMKMEQYRLGEQFIDAVVRERDHAFALHVWQAPENLPTLAELRNPTQWIARIDALKAAVPAG